MKKTLLFLIYMLSMFSLKAQDLLYGIEQVKGTESVVKNRLSEMGALGEYTFSVLLPVGGCPRCEGSIPVFFRDTKKHFPETYTLIIALSDKPEITKSNLSKKDYGTENIYNISYDDPLLESFHFNTDIAGVPYFVIINNKTGDFVNASPLLGIKYDYDFFCNFTKDLEKIKVKKITAKKTGSKDKHIFPTNIQLRSIDDQRLIINNTNTAVSKISRLAFSEDLSKIVLLEYENPNILIAEKQSENYSVVDTIQPITAEFRLFKANNIPEDLFQALMSLNVLQVMYLDVAFSSNMEDLMISVSLPELYWEDSIAEKISYMNKACLLHYNYKTKSRAYIPMQLDSLWITSHSKMFLDEEKQRMFLSIAKGWPAQGTTAEPTSSESDPFNDEFYEFSPMLSVMKLPEATFINHIGKLSDWHKNEQTGYFFYSPKVCFDKDIMAVADINVGDISVFDRNTLKQKTHFNLFDLLANKQLLEKKNTSVRHDSSKSKLQNIIDKKEKLSCRVLDMALSNGFYYFLITDETNVVLYLYNPDTQFIISTNYLETEIAKCKNNNMRIFSDDTGNVGIIAIDDSAENININLIKYLH